MLLIIPLIIAVVIFIIATLPHTGGDFDQKSRTAIGSLALILLIGTVIVFLQKNHTSTVTEQEDQFKILEVMQTNLEEAKSKSEVSAASAEASMALVEPAILSANNAIEIANSVMAKEDALDKKQESIQLQLEAAKAVVIAKSDKIKEKKIQLEISTKLKTLSEDVRRRMFNLGIKNQQIDEDEVENAILEYKKAVENVNRLTDVIMSKSKIDTSMLEADNKFANTAFFESNSSTTLEKLKKEVFLARQAYANAKSKLESLYDSYTTSKVAYEHRKANYEELSKNTSTSVSELQKSKTLLDSSFKLYQEATESYNEAKGYLDAKLSEKTLLEAELAKNQL